MNLRYILLIVLSLCSSLLLARVDIQLPDTKADFSKLEKDASKGNPVSQYKIGYCYVYGIDGICKSDQNKAKKWFTKSADNDNPDACRMLYKMDIVKYSGYGDKAIRIYKEMGTGYAYYCLADIYSYNRNESKSWLKASMNNGYLQAQKDLLNIFKNELTADDFDTWCIKIKDIQGVNVDTSVNLAEQNNSDNQHVVNYDNEIDYYAPRNQENNDNTLALIIGNEHYRDVADVPYAVNDARIFAKYCNLTFGIPEKNVIYLQDATFTDIKKAVKNMEKKVSAKHGEAKVIFYYAGHGIPDIKTNKAYMLPVDADELDVEYCYGVDQMIDDFAKMNSASTICFLDACFCGDTRNNQMLAQDGTRSVKRNVSKSSPKGNLVIFCSASGDETAWPIKEKGHGLFTYYLLKRIQESRGDISLGDLGKYVIDNVVNESTYNDKMRTQTPTINPSSSLISKWKDIRFR